MSVVPSPHAARRWRLWASLCVGWMLFVAATYGRLMGDLSARRLKDFVADANDFFLWQSAAFLLLIAALSVSRVQLIGRVSALCWALSTVVLLFLAGDTELPWKFGVFALWCALAVASLRRWVERFAGPTHASVGMALCLLYAVMIPLSFFLGAFQLLSFWPVALTALAMALPGVRQLASLRGADTSFLSGLDRLSALGATALHTAWVSLAIAFVWASGPEALSDSIRSYLPEIQALARQGGFELQYVDSGRFLPRALQAVGAGGYVLGSYYGAKWLSWLAIVALSVLVMEEIARRSGSLNLAAIGTAATLACPLLLLLSTSLMFDHVMTLFCVAIFVSLSRALQVGSRRGVVLSALLVGAAVQIKYNFLIFAAIWLLWLLIYATRTYGVGAGLKWSLLPFSISVLVGCPWFLYVWLTVGNPVFPFFNEIFRSSYWPEGMSPTLGINKFNLGESLFDRLFFPWTVTFHTSRIHQGPDGSMGFQLLALLPFAFAIRGRFRQAGLDLGIAGMVVVGAVSLSTTYARYWLPGYPLLLIPLFLAARRCFDATGWRIPHWLAPVGIVIIFTGFQLHTPFWVAGPHTLSWKVYTGATSENAWMNQQFPGFPAIQKLNEILEPSDRVLATDYQGVYTIDADVYEFPFWHCLTLDEDNFSINGVRSAELLDRFIERHSIKYWVVDYSRGHFSLFDRELGTSDRYWTVPRLISGSVGVAIFDVGSRVGAPRFRSAEVRHVSATLLPRGKPRKLKADRNGWSDMRARLPEAAARALGESIELPQRGTLAHVFSLPPAAALVNARVHLQATVPLKSTRLVIKWLDDQGAEIDRVIYRFLFPWEEGWAHLFAEVPAAARYGRLEVVRWGEKPVNIGSTELEFLVRARD